MKKITVKFQLTADSKGPFHHIYCHQPEIVVLKIIELSKASMTPLEICHASKGKISEITVYNILANLVDRKILVFEELKEKVPDTKLSVKAYRTNYHESKIL